MAEGRLTEILETIRGNDYLIVQMGHNDATVGKPERYTEPYTEYKHYLKMYIDGARERGAVPVLVTPVARLHMEDGVFVNDFPDYCIAMQQVAEEKGVLLYDLMTRSLQQWEKLGYEKAKELYMISHNGTDCTHFTDRGARLVASLVAEGIRKMLQ